MSRPGVFSGFWEKPPSSFHRWIAAYPFVWVGIVVAVVAAMIGPSAQGGLGWAMFGLFMVALTVAASVGALLTRRRVRQYDARLSE